MQRVLNVALVLSIFLVTSDVTAQCSRGTRSFGTTRGTRIPLASTASGFVSPLGSIRTLNSAGGSVLPIGYRSGMTAQQYVNLQRQNALRQQYLRNLANERLNNTPPDQSVASSDDKETARTERQQRLRKQNAEKALAAAQRAEKIGQHSRAQSLYRQVIRILPDSELSRTAQASLDRVTRTNNLRV